MSTLLLSDLHLPAGPSPLREAFLSFLDGPARLAKQVYLLGDLFEYWIGDDTGLRDYAPEVAALRALGHSGVELFFMHGNRDFVIGPRFAHAAGVTLLQDPVVVELCGKPTLLSHGDLFCTDDVGYQKWRRFSRNKLGLAIFRRLPEALRQRVAGSARRRSTSGKLQKTDAIMDVNGSAILEAFSRYGVTRMIHGHTHRPATHLHPLADGQQGERIVLADWRPQQIEFLACEKGKLQRVRFSSTGWKT